MRKVALAALAAIFIDFLFIPSAASQSAGPAADLPDGGMCADTAQLNDRDRKIAELEQKIRDCEAAKAACTNLEEIKKQLDEQKKLLLECVQKRNELANKLKPVKPYDLVCGSGTIEAMTQGRRECICDPSLYRDAVNVRVDYKDDVKQRIEVNCLSRAQWKETIDELNLLIGTKADNAAFQLLLQQFNNHKVSVDALIQSILARLDSLERRVDALERRMADAERGLGEVRKNVDDLKNELRKDVQLYFGGYGELGERWGLIGSFGGVVGISGRFHKHVGVIALGRVGAAGQGPTGWMGSFSGVLGPIVYFDDGARVGLYAGIAGTQYLRFTNRGNNLEGGNFLGGRIGPEIGVPIMLGDLPLAVIPYVGFGGGRVNSWTPEDRPVHDSGRFQMTLGAMLTLVPGWKVWSTN